MAVSYSPGLVSADRVAELLRTVPTFTLVDQKGVPFVVVGEDAKVTGYFFIEYDEARRILDLATKSADYLIREAKKALQRKPLDSAELVTNPWRQARISTVPLDTAITLATRTISSTSSNYFQVAASGAAIEEALRIIGKDDLAENIVPLFYYKNFTISHDDGNKQAPLYFRQSELEQAYRNANKNAKDIELPSILVTELFATLREMVRPGGTDEDLRTLVFVAPEDSASRVKECQRKGGKEAAFLLGQRNVVL
jgi:hypothetical protein